MCNEQCWMWCYIKWNIIIIVYFNSVLATAEQNILKYIIPQLVFCYSLPRRIYYLLP